MSSIYMMMAGTLHAYPAGLGASVLKRSVVLKKHGIENTILTPEYNINHDDDMQLLIDSGRLTANVRDLYEDLACDEIDQSAFVKIDPFSEIRNKTNFIADPVRKNVERLYVDGVYKYFAWKDDLDNYLFVDHVDSKVRREKRECFDRRGYVRKVELYNIAVNKISNELYYDRSGYCYLNIIYKPDGKSISEILYYRKHTKQTVNLKSKDELLEYWLNEFILKSENTILISEYARYWRSFKRLEQKQKKFEVIYTLHNNHFDFPHKEGSPIKPGMLNIFSHLEHHSNIVVLTEEQKQDIVDEFGHAEKFTVIPHHMSKSIFDARVERKMNRLVTLSRWDESKNITGIIEAFSIVNKVRPETELLIFGRGSNEIIREYKEKISSLGLEESAKIVGFTTNATKEYREASISLYASKFEGFPLSMTESMAEGCIPVSYCLKYGPKDMITDGVDGIICEETPVAMAQSVLTLLDNQEKLEQMRVEAMKKPAIFSEERLANEWIALFNKIGFNIEKANTAE